MKSPSFLYGPLPLLLLWGPAYNLIPGVCSTTRSQVSPFPLGLAAQFPLHLDDRTIHSPQRTLETVSIHWLPGRWGGDVRSAPWRVTLVWVSGPRPAILLLRQNMHVASAASWSFAHFCLWSHTAPACD